MAALVQALDSFTPVKLGENGHTELAWSHDIEERIAQFDFQCVRATTHGLDELSKTLYMLLYELRGESSDDAKENKRKQLLTALFKMIARTRDIEGGKGEYAISYMMVWTWYKFNPEQAKIALALFVFPPNRAPGVVSDIEQIPYGSWKDMKYFCDYVRSKRNGYDSHPLIDYCVTLINKQLREDKTLYDAAGSQASLSLVSRWVPREKSKFGWMYKTLACDFFPEYTATVKHGDVAHYEKAVKKCMTQYRILCATLNRHLDTVQIKQTAKNWAAIDHSKTTSITMAKQRAAFLNIKRGIKKEKRTDDPDRIHCADNLCDYLNSLKKDGKEVKGKNLGFNDFTKQAFKLMEQHNYYTSTDKTEFDILNSQWRDNGAKKNADGLGNMVAMVDMSGSMDGEPKNAAMALGCRVAEKSVLGKRIMTFADEPSWVNLDDCATFVDMIAKLNGSANGYNTDFYKALDLILAAIIDYHIPPRVVENMILAIFSDMQIDDSLNGGYDCYTDEIKEANRGKWATMHEQIKTKYAATGMKHYGVPLIPPHILFWNLRQTNGFPCLSTVANCSMMSGYDPTVLNMFCEKGMEALKEMTPYKNLMIQLDNERYRPMDVINSTM